MRATSALSSLYTRAFELLPQPLFVFAPSGALVASNAAADALLATGGGNLAAQLWHEAASVDAHHRSASCSFPFVMHADGVEHVYHCSATPLDGAGNLLLQLTGPQTAAREPDAATAGGELRRVQAALAESEERLRLATQVGAIGIWDWDGSSGELLWDARMRAIHGVGANTPVTFKVWRNAVVPEDWPTVAATSRATIARGAPQTVEYRVLLPDGKLRYVSTVGGAITGENGALWRQIGVSVDITARKTLETALQHSEERLRYALDAANEAIWDANLATGEILGNDQWFHLLGYAPGEHPSTIELWRSTVHPEDAQRTFADLQAHLMGGKPERRAEYRVITKTGEVRWLFSAGKVVESDDAGHALRVVGATLDITERKRLEMALRDMNAELEQHVAVRTAELRQTVAELMRANAGKDAFMAAISHELRTPLTGILGMVELLESEMRGSLNAHQKRYIASIGGSSDRLLTLINGVINYTHAMSADNPVVSETCRMAELCAISVKVARFKAAKKHQTIELDVDPANLQITSDGNSILQILGTLLDNAVKFTPDGGRLGVTVHPVEDGKAVQITVWDTGIGITPEQRPHLFKLFTQLDQRLARQFEGIGLGLAFVKRKVELLGGTVDVESQAGNGSQFIIMLPANSLARSVVLSTPGHDLAGRNGSGGGSV